MPEIVEETTVQKLEHTMNESAPASIVLTDQSVTDWVTAYLKAWTTNDRDDIANLFTEDAEYHEEPFDTEWVGRGEIIAGWRSRWDWQQGGWTFEWSIRGIDDSVAHVVGIGRYAELGDFDNDWTVTFDAAGRSSRFEMVNTERA